jgi:tetratricopeptide (TPR) repeat protein
VATSESELSQPVFRLLSPEAFDNAPSDGSIVASLSTSEQEHIHQLVAQANQQIRDSHEEIARAREQLTDTARQISALVETVEKKDLEIKGLESRLADLREFVKQQTAAITDSEPTWLQRLLLEVLILAAMVVVLAVTLSRWADARRRQGGNADEATISLELPAPARNPIRSLPVAVENEVDTQLPEEEHRVEPSADDEQSLGHAECEEIELQGDTLMEANAYLAYGYHEKAKEVLEAFIKENPAHAESRLLILRVLHTIREKRRFRRHAEALLELVDEQFDERWTEAARLGRALLPEERLFDENAHRRAEDAKWEETVWTGSRPELADCDEHIYLDIDEFKYVDLFLLDKAEDTDDSSAPEPSVDAVAEPENFEVDLEKWRAKLLGSDEDRGFSLDPDGPGDESADEEQS